MGGNSVEDQRKRIDTEKTKKNKKETILTSKFNGNIVQSFTLFQQKFTSFNQ